MSIDALQTLEESCIYIKSALDLAQDIAIQYTPLDGAFTSEKEVELKQQEVKSIRMGKQLDTDIEMLLKHTRAFRSTKGDRSQLRCIRQKVDGRVHEYFEE